MKKTIKAPPKAATTPEPQQFEHRRQVIITRNYTVTAPDGVVILWDGQTGSANCEDAELIDFVGWFKHEYPQHADRIMHIPNESMKPVFGIMKDKKKGVLDGAPDLLIFPDNSPPIAFEFKRRDLKKSLTSTKDRIHFERQLSILSGLAKAGCICAVICGSGAGKYFIKQLAIA